MNSQELETAVRLKLDLVVMILNDSAYGMIRWKQAVDGFRTSDSHSATQTSSVTPSPMAPGVPASARLRISFRRWRRLSREVGSTW